MKKKIEQQPNDWAIKLIEVNNKIKCYTKESVDRKIGKMQERIDFLMGQNQRLKRAEKELELWKKTTAGQSRWSISQLIKSQEQSK
jgi:hypothetical protein